MILLRSKYFWIWLSLMVGGCGLLYCRHADCEAKSCSGELAARVVHGQCICVEVPR